MKNATRKSAFARGCASAVTPLEASIPMIRRWSPAAMRMACPPASVAERTQANWVEALIAI